MPAALLRILTNVHFILVFAKVVFSTKTFHLFFCSSRVACSSVEGVTQKWFYAKERLFELAEPSAWSLLRAPLLFCAVLGVCEWGKLNSPKVVACKDCVAHVLNTCQDHFVNVLTWCLLPWFARDLAKARRLLFTRTIHAFLCRGFFLPHLW